MFRRSEINFQNYRARAGTRNSYARLGMGILLLAVLYAGSIVAIVSLATVFEWFSILRAFAAPDLDAQNIAIVLLVSFVTMHLALMTVLWVLHGKGYGALWGREQLKPFLITLVICLVLSGLGAYFRIASGEALPQLNFHEWLRLVPFLMVILAIQISAEEFVFRGYLFQHLAGLWNNRIAYIFFPSILFGLLHFDGSWDAATPWVLGTTTLIGIIAAELTRATGGLGAACALHFVNNFIVMGILPPSGTLSGFGLYVSRFGLDDFEHIVPLLQNSVMTLSGVLLAYYAILGVRAYLRK